MSKQVAVAITGLVGLREDADRAALLASLQQRVADVLRTAHPVLNVEAVGVSLVDVEAPEEPSVTEVPLELEPFLPTEATVRGRARR